MPFRRRMPTRAAQFHGPSPPCPQSWLSRPRPSAEPHQPRREIDKTTFPSPADCPVANRRGRRWFLVPRKQVFAREEDIELESTAELQAGSRHSHERCALLENQR